MSHRKYRTHSKIHTLPEGVRAMLDDMLSDISVTYTDITEWLKREGYKISRSSIGRYALETQKLAGRLIEAQEQTRELLKFVKDNDGENMTEGAMQIATHKLTARIAMLEEEIDKMDPVDAIKLITTISRSKAYKDKTYAAIKSSFEKAYKQFMGEINKELEAHPDIIKRLEEIANDTLGKIDA